jgi:hypothetical protein
MCQLCNENELMEPNERVHNRENSVDRRLDGNGVPEVAYTGHTVWLTCQRQRTAPLNRPCRREGPERKPSAWGLSSYLSLSQNPSLIIRTVLAELRQN